MGVRPSPLPSPDAAGEAYKVAFAMRYQNPSMDAALVPPPPLSIRSPRPLPLPIPYTCPTHVHRSPLPLPIRKSGGPRTDCSTAAPERCCPGVCPPQWGTGTPPPPGVGVGVGVGVPLPLNGHRRHRRRPPRGVRSSGGRAGKLADLDPPPQVCDRQDRSIGEQAGSRGATQGTRGTTQGTRGATQGR